MEKILVNGTIVENFFRKTLNVLCKLRRWSLHGGSSNYTELSKQSLNICISYVIANSCKEEGMEIKFERFPWIATKRAIQKTVNGDIRDDHINEICQLAGISRKDFDKLIEERIINNMSTLDRLLNVSDQWTETIIYKAATKLATLIEFRELGIKDNSTENEILNSLNSFSKILGIKKFFSEESEEFKFCMEISKLRFSIRWAKQFRAKDCSVLEHLGETAMFAWLMALEKNPEDEITATHLFWCGAFHDLPERWTGDMASPIKDSIPNLRKGTELFEGKMLQQHVYDVLPNYLGNAIKSIMLEELGNEQYKADVKLADYVSATCECYRNIVSGSRDIYFFNVIQNDYSRKEILPTAFERLITAIYVEVSNLGYLTNTMD